MCGSLKVKCGRSSNIYVILILMQKPSESLRSNLSFNPILIHLFTNKVCISFILVLPDCFKFQHHNLMYIFLNFVITVSSSFLLSVFSKAFILILN